MVCTLMSLNAGLKGVSAEHKREQTQGSGSRYRKDCGANSGAVGAIEMFHFVPINHLDIMWAIVLLLQLSIFLSSVHTFDLLICSFSSFVVTIHGA